MPSPTCQVKEGTGAYGPTTNGVDVTAGATITIDLIDKSVDSWALTCLTTDELSDKATPNAALAASINPVTKRATYVAPVAGRTYRFQSIVDGGVDANGRPRASYTTTFCVYVPVAVTGRRCLATDEAMEGNAAFGWISAINNLLRNPTTAVSAGVATHLQAGDGAGGLADSGLTGAAGVLGATTVNAALVAATAVRSDNYTDATGGAQLLGYVGGDTLVGAGGNAVRTGAPAIGLLGGGNGYVTIDMLDADYTAVQAEYDQVALREGGATTFTGVRKLTLPDATNARAYFRLIWCNNANAVNMTVSDVSNPATVVTVTDGMACWVMVNALGAFRASPEFDPTV